MTAMVSGEKTGGEVTPCVGSVTLGHRGPPRFLGSSSFSFPGVPGKKRSLSDTKGDGELMPTRLMRT